MAIAFPNFLGVPVRNPDYSGIGDLVSNYYAGKNMPKDDLIKAIQAQFARPNAEQSLLSSKLSNKKTQLDIDKLMREAAEQKSFEQQLKAALAGNTVTTNAGQPMPAATPRNNMTAINPALGTALNQPPQNYDEGIDPTKMEPRFRKFDQMATGLPDSAYRAGASPAAAQPAIAGASPMTAMQGSPVTATAPAPEEEPHEVVISKGDSHLAGIDALWDHNPLSREFLKKKGYEKTEKIDFDKKTGRTSIVTKYPSGKVTTKMSGAMGSENGIPLTNKLISKHQNIIASIDTAMPILQEILKKKQGIAESIQPFPRSSGYLPGMGYVPGFGSLSNKYENQVNAALDSMIGAYGLPMTNEGIETVKKQLLIGHNETDAAYKRRLKEVIKDLERRKVYSSNEVKKSNKIQPISQGSDEQSYSSNDWEQAE